MTEYSATYLIITGATTARRVPLLIAALQPHVPNLLTLLTPNARRVISPRELTLVPGHRIVESYFDDAILPRPPDGVVLVAPCTFNTLNKLTLGIADNLPLSVAAEALGRGNPVIVAVSVNDSLWSHPRTGESIERLRSWGATVIEPVRGPDGRMTMADEETIAATTAQALSG